MEDILVLMKVIAKRFAAWFEECSEVIDHYYQGVTLINNEKAMKKVLEQVSNDINNQAANKENLNTLCNLLSPNIEDDEGNQQAEQIAENCKNDNLNQLKINKRRRIKSRRIDKSSKRPMTPFIAYFNEQKVIVREKFPDLNMKGWAKIIADKWKKLTEEEKQKYKDRYAAQFQQYTKLKKINNSSTLKQESAEENKLLYAKIEEKALRANESGTIKKAGDWRLFPSVLPELENALSDRKAQISPTSILKEKQVQETLFMQTNNM